MYEAQILIQITCSGWLWAWGCCSGVCSSCGAGSRAGNWHVGERQSQARRCSETDVSHALPLMQPEQRMEERERVNERELKQGKERRAGHGER